MHVIPNKEPESTPISQTLSPHSIYVAHLQLDKVERPSTLEADVIEDPYPQKR